MLAFPIIIDGKVVGVLSFLSPEVGAFNKREQDIGSIIADIAAIGIRQHDTLIRAAENAEDFVSSKVVHQLTNPMGAIRAWINRLQDNYGAIIDQYPNISQGFNIIKSEAEAAMDLVQEIRKNSHKRQTRPLDVTECLKAALKSRAIPASIKVKENIAPEPIYVLADGYLEFVVFVALLNNALEAMPEDGYLEVGVKRAGEFAEAWVQDNGHGIPPASYDLVFMPWYSTKGDDEGHSHGRGLTLARKYIVWHGGTINPDGEIVGGCKMIVRLPLAHTAM